MTLEETLIALCEKHGLDSIHLDYHKGMLTYAGLQASVFWYAGSACQIAQGKGDTFSEALTKAIGEANVRRSITPVVDLPNIAPAEA